jgi:Ca2+-binding RTX toxin-like protein
VLTGGAGADTFVFQPDAGLDTVTDFSPDADGDRLDIRDLLVGYDASASLLSEYVSISSDGADATISVDRDGAGSDDGFQPVATLQGLTGLLLNDLLANDSLIVS